MLGGHAVLPSPLVHLLLLRREERGEKSTLALGAILVHVVLRDGCLEREGGVHCGLGGLGLRELLGDLDKELRDVLVGLGTRLHEQAVVGICVLLGGLWDEKER